MSFSTGAAWKQQGGNRFTDPADDAIHQVTPRPSYPSAPSAIDSVSSGRSTTDSDRRLLARDDTEMIGSYRFERWSDPSYLPAVVAGTALRSSS
jgi:hypothetical protein